MSAMLPNGMLSSRLTSRVLSVMLPNGMEREKEKRNHQNGCLSISQYSDQTKNIKLILVFISIKYFVDIDFSTCRYCKDVKSIKFVNR